MTTGTKTAATLSTNFCTGALLPCASCTSLMICASIVSLPTFLAEIFKTAGLVDCSSDDEIAGLFFVPEPIHR